MKILDSILMLLLIIIFLLFCFCFCCGFVELNEELPSYNSHIACPTCHEWRPENIGLVVDEIWWEFEGGSCAYNCLSCFNKFISFNKKCYEKDRFIKLLKQIEIDYLSYKKEGT